MTNTNIILGFLRGHCDDPYNGYVYVPHVANKGKTLKCYYINTYKNNRVMVLEYMNKIIAIKLYGCISLLHTIRQISPMPCRIEKLINEFFNQGIAGTIQKFDLHQGLSYNDIKSNF